MSKAVHARSKKRKHGTEPEAGEKLMRQKRIKNTACLDGDDNELVATGLNHIFAEMDRRLLSDYVAQRVRHFGGDLSSLEVEDRYIPDIPGSENAFQDTSCWNKSRSLDNLPGFLEYFSMIKNKPTSLSSAPSMNGAPHTIVVTGAGIRAANLARALRKFQTKQASVVKLFAKHTKLKDAIAFVKKSRMGIAIGTPRRLIDLLNEGVLSFEKLQRLVVDCSHMDQKKRGILDMNETLIPLVELLNQQGLKERYTVPENGVDLLFY